MTPEQAKAILRDYEDISAEERNDEDRARLSGAVDSLHPETKRSRSDAETIAVIDFLRGRSDDDDDPVTSRDIMGELGLGANSMRGVIEKAIDDHKVWIGDNSDTETRPSRRIYFIASEGYAPAKWIGYVPGKRDADSTKSDRAALMQEKRMHVAFLRAYASFPPERQSVIDNEKRFSDAVEYLHPAPQQHRRRPLDQTPEETEMQRAAVRKHSTDAERLLAAVGVEGLRDSLPSPFLAMIEDGDEMTDARVAEAAIAVHGSDALCECRCALDHLDPPERWAGLKPAVEFVRSLGFSSEWAGARNRSLPPYVEVEGPYALPELHAYQKAIVKNVRSMLLRSDGDRAQRRGMISMPTGSGKTRVAVQAVVEAIRHDGFEGGVLWVADHEELCEQAFEAWRQVWSGIGAHATRLLISGMWGRRLPPMPKTRLHVVVATIQTLRARISDRDYGFLRDFTLVVFDEAHRSVAPTFTSVMQKIGLTRRQRPDEPHLLGLTATPYRGHDARETERLANRYRGNRLDTGAFASDDPQAVIRQLQDMRILSRADHETIEGGVFSLDDREKEQAASAPWLPRTVEDRIAQDSDRTRRIVEAYETHVRPDWPTLIFATSVEHAQTVAALLKERGFRSRAISGDTRGAARRRAVEEFRRGEINVLVNCRLLAEGFDAPKTRAIIIARPVYSPNLYFQMIGRGLRGVKNGGNDRCLILNVQDNIENFQRELAFSDLDWLWDQAET